MVMAANADANVPTREEGASEIDPNKLIQKNNVLGFEKPPGFEEVTNFDISICGYEADNGLIIGHILEIKIAITDLLQENVDSSRLVVVMNFNDFKGFLHDDPSRILHESKLS